MIAGCASTTPVCSVSETNPFPFVIPSNPSTSSFEPLDISVYDPKITIPYAQNFNLTIERQLGTSTVVSLGYVGSEGRHLPMTTELNPLIIPTPSDAKCIAAIAATVPFQPLALPGDFKYPGNIFASVGQVATAGSSNYNAFQATVNHTLSHGLQLLVSYTYSHALDFSSGFENSGFAGNGSGGFGELRVTNPFNPQLYDYGDSNYDARHRLVVSYVYYLPSVRHFHAFQWIPSRVADGWNISGITTLQSGFPLDVVDSAFPSLTSWEDNFYSNFQGVTWDVPNYVGPIQYTNPRNLVTISPGVTARYWFNPTNPTGCSSAVPGCQIGGFEAPALGTEGNAGRDLLHGPGRNNFDFALMKDTQITERTKLELRFEFYNLFNHTQFDPNGIVTDFNSPSFGQETAAFAPRTIQLAAEGFLHKLNLPIAGSRWSLRLGQK